MTALFRPHPQRPRRPMPTVVPAATEGGTGNARQASGRTSPARTAKAHAATARTANSRTAKVRTASSGTPRRATARTSTGVGHTAAGRTATGRIGTVGPRREATGAGRTSAGRIGTAGPRRQRAGTGHAAARPVPQPVSRRRAGMVAAALLFAAVLAGNVIVHAATTQGQFELEHLKDGAREKEAAYQQLRLQMAELEAPERIVARARQMGMVEPGKVTYLTASAKTSADDRTSTTVPDTPAEAAQGWGQVKPHLDGRR